MWDNSNYTTPHREQLWEALEKKRRLIERASVIEARLENTKHIYSTWFGLVKKETTQREYILEEYKGMFGLRHQYTTCAVKEGFMTEEEKVLWNFCQYSTPSLRELKIWLEAKEVYLNVESTRELNNILGWNDA